MHSKTNPGEMLRSQKFPKCDDLIEDDGGCKINDDSELVDQDDNDSWDEKVQAQI